MFFSDRDSDAGQPLSIHPVDPKTTPDWLNAFDERERRWIDASSFEAEPGSHLIVPATDGSPGRILVGYCTAAPCWTLAGLPGALRSGDYALAGEFDDAAMESLAVGWALGHYRFDRYKPGKRSKCRLRVAEGRIRRLEIIRDALFRTRDLINTPASDLGPAELAETVQELARRCGADTEVVEGEALAEEYPAIHAVGRAASRGPRLIRLEWGNPAHPALALVGKGVIFDSGGLNIKPGSGMVLMKKDMGGAAHVIGLAEMIMRLELPVHLRVYIPAVENAISGDAYRPSDILTTRNGTTVEIGNTDAEGRIVLSDALTLAAEEDADRIIDFATLTGAARVALGEDIPPIYARNAEQARAIQDLSMALEDPLWHMPLHKPYKSQIQPAIADLSNTGTTSQGGSLTAALFLDHFVPEGIDWMHLDIYAWNLSDRPGRPPGGEAQGLRAMLAWLEGEYAG